MENRAREWKKCPIPIEYVAIVIKSVKQVTFFLAFQSIFLNAN